MILSNKLKYSIFFLASLIFILIDQTTKLLAKRFLKGERTHILIDNVLELVYVENEGAAFGILQKKQVLFYILTIVVIAGLLVLLYRMQLTKHNLWYYIFYILLFSGAIGNFIDRIKNKYVVDFIYFKPIDFPVFNFADIYITIACAVILIASFTIYKKD